MDIEPATAATPTESAEPSAWSREFDLEPGLVYLNHAGIAPWPRRTAAAIARFADDNVRYGARDYPAWMQIEAALRRDLGRLVGAAAADVALLKNTSEGLSFIAEGLDWCPGDNVVSSDQEFPSNRYVWEALGRRGVGLRCAALGAADHGPEEALMAACDRRTRLMSVSAVQYASGLRMDLARLGSFCRRRGIVFCVDAIQWVGADVFDVEAFQADAVVADGHKWMLGPEGVALFYVRPSLRERLRLSEIGWHSVAQAGDYERCLWQPAPDARRFECGSPNMLGIQGLAASVALLLEVGGGKVYELIERNISYLIEEIAFKRGFPLLSPALVERRCGILCFAVDGLEPARLHAALRERQVVGAVRGGGIRWSPHFYTRRQDLDTALAALDEAVEACRRSP